MRKEIIDFLEDAKKTPKELPHIDYDRHLLAMLEIYRRIDIDRPNVLAQDCFMLLSTYRHYKISFESGTDFMRFGMSAIEMMVSLLISATDQYTQLPDSAINELGLYPFMDGTFGDYMRQHYRAKEIHEQEIAQAQNKADGSGKGTGMGNNTTANHETPPAAQETPKVAVMQPYTPNPVGRRKEDDFSDTIADIYATEGKADLIQEHIKKAISDMTEPMAIFALFVECYNNEILKFCPKYKQALSLIENEAMKRKYYRKFHNDNKNIYFDKAEGYYKLAETDNIQNGRISKYILQAEPIVKELLLLLEPPDNEEEQSYKAQG